MGHSLSYLSAWNESSSEVVGVFLVEFFVFELLMLLMFLQILDELESWWFFVAVLLQLCSILMCPFHVG